MSMIWCVCWFQDRQCDGAAGHHATRRFSSGATPLPSTGPAPAVPGQDSQEGVQGVSAAANQRGAQQVNVPPQENLEEGETGYKQVLLKVWKALALNDPNLRSQWQIYVCLSWFHYGSYILSGRGKALQWNVLGYYHFFVVTCSFIKHSKRQQWILCKSSNALCYHVTFNGSNVILRVCFKCSVL